MWFGLVWYGLLFLSGLLWLGLALSDQVWFRLV
jgi:hypothetical protein